MVFGRRGLGGPQLAEVDRMLDNEQSETADADAWVAQRERRLADADRVLQERFSALAAG
jgi:argininosuccinate lyase